MEPIISVKDLRKEYKRTERHQGPFATVKNLFARKKVTKVAVDHVSFDIMPGELVGYIGPNGAGKSTTIKVLTGILSPTSGEVRVAGVDPHKHRTQLVMKVGVVFGQRHQLWWDLPTVDSFELLKRLYRVPQETYEQNMRIFGDLLELGPFLSTPVRQLSLGQRMRADLAAALLHNPDILYLDEPTIGLDVVAKQRIREFIRELNRERQITVILTTHDMQDIERICNRMILIDSGKALYDGPIEQIKQEFGKHRTLVVDLDELPEAIAVPGCDLYKREGNRIWLRFDRTAFSASELIAAVTARYTVRDLTIEEPQIERIVADIYQAGVADATAVSGN